MSNISQETVNTIIKEGTRNITLWCADGSFCKVPKGKSIQMEGGGMLNINGGGMSLESGQPLLLRDKFHGIEYNSTFDGPVMYGFSGGAVGWKNDRNEFQRRISWDRQNVGIAGRLYVNPGSGDRDIITDLDNLRNEINDLKNNVVRKDRKYFIQSGKGGVLTDIDGGDGRFGGGRGQWETMNFLQI